MLNEPNSQSNRNPTQRYDLETPFIDFAELSDSLEPIKTASLAYRPLQPVEAALAELTPFESETPSNTTIAFQIAYNRSMQKEGGWSNKRSDPGGETYRGITTKYFPNWAGWRIIRETRSRPDFQKILDANQELQKLVAEFYFNEFWNKLRAGEIQSQAIANELFDASINLGIPPAVKILQQAINYLTAPPALPVAVDGKPGPATVLAVNHWLKESSVESRCATNSLLGLLLALRANHYVQSIDNDACKKCFFEGWIRRILGSPALVERGV